MPDEDLSPIKRMDPDPTVEIQKTQDVVQQIIAGERAAQTAKDAIAPVIEEPTASVEPDESPTVPEIEEPTASVESDESPTVPEIEEPVADIEADDLPMCPVIEEPVPALEADDIPMDLWIDVPAADFEPAEAPVIKDERPSITVEAAEDVALAATTQDAPASMDTEAVFDELGKELGMDPISPVITEQPEAELSVDIQRKMELAIENLTVEEIRYLDDLLGENIAVRFRDYWDQAIAASPRARELMEEVVAGTAPPSAARDAYDLVRDKFWKRVPLDEFDRAGFTVVEGRAPVLELADGSRQTLTLEHFMRRVDDPSRAIDPSNLMFSLSRENSVFLEDVRRIIRRRFKELGYVGRDPWDKSH